MSLTVIFRETALRNLARIRGEDKDLFTRTRRAISALADQPYPESAVAWGATGVYHRHHSRDYRAVCAIAHTLRPPASTPPAWAGCWRNLPAWCRPR